MSHLKKIGFTGKKLIGQGLIILVIGISLCLTGAWLPLLAIRLALYGIIAISLFELIMRLFKQSKSSDHWLVLILKIIVFTTLAGAEAVLSLPIYLVAILAGIYQLFTALINIITFSLLWKDGVVPRWRYLLDAGWLTILGSVTLFTSTESLKLQAWVIGIYLFLYGLTNLRDGLFFEQEINHHALRRHFRLPLPLFIAALLPSLSLKQVNQVITQEGLSTSRKNKPILDEGSRSQTLEVFIHVGENGFGAIGHVDLSYKGKVYGYGSYDVQSEKLFGAIGDGVLFTCQRDAYVSFCNQEGMTMFGYQLSLSEAQARAVESRLNEIEDLLIPWIPLDQNLSRDEQGHPIQMYAYRMGQAIGSKAFKFSGSKFKTYFVLSTNCVLLADSVIGKVGIDLLGIRGFIAPGTYLSYFEAEYQKPFSFVTDRRIYSPLVASGPSSLELTPFSNIKDKDLT